MTQQIRRSQFITTYGPGALIEGPLGPRIIPSTRIGLFVPGSRLDPANYEISDHRMSRGLLNGSRIYRLPSNAELGQSDKFYIYRTKPFPTWKLCLNTNAHTSPQPSNFYVLYREQACPVCQRIRGRGIEAIRFVVACPNGHLDEFDWHFFVHRGGTCHARWFMWRGGGGALSRITIECPRCRSQSLNLGSAYGQNFRCSGRMPEQEPLDAFRPIAGGCGRPAKIIQRQASNLRIPELRTLFSIPPRTTALHNQLHVPPVWDNILGHMPASIDELRNTMQNLVNAGRIPQGIMIDILNHPWEEIVNAINDNRADVPRTYPDLILEEFRALIDASHNGAPPVTRPPPSSEVIFHVDPNLVRVLPSRLGGGFRITPVLTLRTVKVQLGYRREIDTGANTFARVVQVDINDTQDPQLSWYPGAEFLGEGIFINFASDSAIQFTGTAASHWNSALTSSSYPQQVFRDQTSHDELRPSFVWWHTLSHLLLRAVSTEAGYSSASIGERVYLDTSTGNPRGGLLLYATQPGTEGTLGGLIALVPFFEEFLNRAFAQAETCSGDPLCKEHSFKPDMYNGAACYGCLLVSETSCEHRNMWLDRNILLENPL
jgi:hypothetical protein